MILYSIQWQASYHGNWSCHTNEPATIWIMQIIIIIIIIGLFAQKKERLLAIYKILIK
jgi:hypothetical protein